MPGWHDVTDLPGLLEWMAGCTVLYAEGEDLCADACDGALVLLKKSGRYLALDIDTDIEYPDTPIMVRYLIIDDQEGD